VLLEDYRPDSIPGDPTAKIHHLERNFHAFRLFECVQCVGDSPESTRLERSQQSLTFRPMGERIEPETPISTKNSAIIQSFIVA
jgi:hypothetical protein